MGEISFEPKWYVLYTRPKAEKKLKQNLDKMSISSYLPLLKVKKKWSDRYKWLDIPLFPGYIFVKIIYPIDSLKILKDPNSVSFVFFQGTPASIQEEEIEMIQIFLNEYPDKVRVEEGKLLQEGNEVELISGPFAGRKAIIEKVKKSYNIILRIPSLNKNLRIEVKKEDIGNNLTFI